MQDKATLSSDLSGIQDSTGAALSSLFLWKHKAIKVGVDDAEEKLKRMEEFWKTQEEIERRMRNQCRRKCSRLCKKEDW